jgi:flavin-dependent dehydrogenase
MIYDAIIIGAGPAGSAAAILLSLAGKRVLVIEKSRFPREKLCGEFLSPECLTVFERLGVSERIFAAGARTIRRFKLYAPDGRSLEVPMEWIAEGHSSAIGLSRATMDSILLERAREVGADIREGVSVLPKFHREAGVSFIEGKGGKNSQTNGAEVEQFAANLVIDASGRNGVFASQVRQPASRFAGSRVFGCKVHLRGVEGLADLGELFFFRDGYGGLSEIEGDRVNLCFLTTEATLKAAKGDRQRLLDLTLRSNKAALDRLRHATIDGEWLGTGPVIYGRRQTMPGVLTIGDAAAFIDPFTGSGMLLALTGGEMAANVVNQAFAENVRDVETIAGRYDQLHRAQFGWRYRATSLLRSLAFKPAARNALVTLLSRNQSLMKLAALSTRQKVFGSTPRLAASAVTEEVKSN